jgi:hypothetical protein
VKYVKVEDHNFTMSVHPPPTIFESVKVKYFKPQDESWMSVKHVTQCFNVGDPLNKACRRRQTLAKFKRSIVFTISYECTFMYIILYVIFVGFNNPTGDLTNPMWQPSGKFTKSR